MKVAVLIFAMPTTSAPTERSFSTMSNVHTKTRNRLTNARSAKISFIKYNYNIQHRRQSTSKVETAAKRSVSESAANNPIRDPTLLDDENIVIDSDSFDSGADDHFSLQDTGDSSISSDEFDIDLVEEIVETEDEDSI